MDQNTPRILAGRYEVGELIGRGGMAEVHIGHDARLGRTVAIKVLRSDLARDPSFLTRFRREAQAAAALNHPAIVAVYDTGEETLTDPASGQPLHIPFIVMEYVEGHTVRDILRGGEAVPIEEAVEITIGVLSALEYSHHAGIIHRDIKPANVMITPTGAVKVMDFGIARAAADPAAGMTATHAVIGTAQYLSPEQARGEQVDARSDLYSAGCVLFELLTGRPPFTGDSPVAVAYQHVGQAPQKPSEIASDVPEALDRITGKALAKERGARYGSAAEFRADLENFVRGGVVAAPVAVASPAFAATDNATQLMTPSIAPTQQWGPVSQGPPPIMAAPVEVGQEEEPPNRTGLIAALIALAVVLVGGIIAIILLSGGGGEGAELREVPEVPVGSTLEQARAIIEDADFRFDYAIDPHAEGLPETSVRQEPEAGEEAEIGSRVTVFFTPEAQPGAVPNVTGLSRIEACDAIEDAGFTCGEVTVESSPNVPLDRVTRTEPSAGEVVAPGTAITIFLSDGNVEIPDLIGMTEEDALETISDLGLQSTIQHEATPDHEPGTVVRQTPDPGLHPQNQRVVIWIAEEMPTPPVPVPAMTGNSWNEALAACEHEGFDCRRGADVTEWPGGADPSTPFQCVSDRVLRSEPAAGSMLEEGSIVTIIMFTGTCPIAQVAVPTVTTWDAFNAACATSGLTCTRVDAANDAAPGTVIGITMDGTAVTAGTQVNVGSTLSVTVSTGPAAVPEPSPTPTPDENGEG
ncbi:MAG: Stk1 family PASTA domain-containing Ser/Thr kinase [Promicromonosporaceae bacterium]|nr:Stk1 family PASTA domain-containing Ser/Thr kinase [Promicromonosporaceae bacterium]